MQGLLIPPVAAMPNVTYVPRLAEAAETREALLAFTSGDSSSGALSQLRQRQRQEQSSPIDIGICVCDVNIEPFIAAELLVDHILPFMTGGDRSSIGRTDSSCCTDSDSCTDSNGSSDSNSGFASSGYVILTLKLPRNPSERRIDTSFKIACNILSQQEAVTSARGRRRLLDRQIPSIPQPPLNAPANPLNPPEIGGGGRAARCWDFKMVHLNANSRNERTLVCRIGGAGGGGGG